jgi:hypothetical protein
MTRDPGGLTSEGESDGRKLCRKPAQVGVGESNPNIVAARVEQQNQNKMPVPFDFSLCRVYIKFNEMGHAVNLHSSSLLQIPAIKSSRHQARPHEQRCPSAKYPYES